MGSPIAGLPIFDKGMLIMELSEKSQEPRKEKGLTQ